MSASNPREDIHPQNLSSVPAVLGMYADASGFELILDVYPGGAVVASSSDLERLKAVTSHLLKPLGFQYILGGKRWEHSDGGKRVVESLQATAAKDGFRLVVRDKGGLSDLPRKTLAERMKEREGAGESVAVLPSGSPAKIMRADGGSVTSPQHSGCRQLESSPTTTATCPPTLERKAAGAAGAKCSSGGRAAPRGSSRRSLAATLDSSTYAPSIVDARRPEPPTAHLHVPPSSGKAAAPTPPAAAASAASAAPFDEYFDEYCLSDDVLAAALDAAQGGSKQPDAAGPVATTSSTGGSTGHASAPPSSSQVATLVRTPPATRIAGRASPADASSSAVPDKISGKISGAGGSPDAISSFASSVDDPISSFSSPSNSQANAAAPAATPAAGAPQTQCARAPGQPVCKYGLGCYRQHPAHWIQFDHPASHPFLRTLAAEEGASSVPPSHDTDSPSPPLLID